MLASKTLQLFRIIQVIKNADVDTGRYVQLTNRKRMGNNLFMKAFNSSLRKYTLGNRGTW